MRTIATAGMDGSDRKMLAVVNMEEPVGLTLDHVTGRLYWIGRDPECAPGSSSHLCLLSPVLPKGYKCVCPEGMFLLPSGTCSELKLLFSSGKHLYLLKVGFIGTAIEKTLVQEHRRNIYLLDVDWKRNLIYWTNAQDSCSD